MALANEVVLGLSAVGGREAAGETTAFSDAVKGLVETIIGLSDAEIRTIETNKALIDSFKKVIVSTGELNNEDKALLKSMGIVITENGRLAASNQEVAASARELSAAEKQIGIAAEVASLKVQAGQNAFGGMYKNFNRMANMGSPAILKAATWSAFAVGGIAYEAIKTYTSFNKQLTLSVTQAGRPFADLGKMQSAAIDASKSTGTALNDVANIMYRVSSATAGMRNGMGASMPMLASMTKQVAQLAMIGGVGGGAPLEQMARVMGALANTNLPGLGTDPAKISAFVNAMTGAGDVRMTDVISSLGRGVLSTAAAKGVGASSVGAYIDLLTSQGTPGSTAGTYVKTALSMLTGPGAQAAKSLAMLGIKTGDLNLLLKNGGISTVAQYLREATMKFDPSAFNSKYKGMTGAAGATALLENWGVGNIPKSVIAAWAKGNLQNMSAKDLGTTSYGPNGQAVSGQDFLNTLQNLIITKAFGGSRSAASIFSLINDPSKIQGIQTNIEKRMTPAELQKSIDITNKTPAVQFAKMKTAIMADFLTIGKAITPAALGVGKAFTGLINIITKFKPLLSSLVAFAGILIAKGVGRKIGEMGTGFLEMRGESLLKREERWNKRFGGRYSDIFGGVGKNQKLKDLALAKRSEADAKSGDLFLKYIQQNTVAQEKGTVAQEQLTAALRGDAVAQGGSGGGTGATGKELRKQEKELKSQDKFMAKAIAESDKQRLKTENNLRKIEEKRIASMVQYQGPLTQLSLQGVGVKPLTAAEKFMMQEYRTGQMDLHGSDKLHTTAVQKWLHANEYDSSPAAANKAIANMQPHLDMYKYAENAAPAPKVTLAQSLKYRLTGVGVNAAESEVAGVAEKGLLSKLGGGVISKVAGMGLGEMAGGALGMLGGPMGTMLMSAFAPMLMPVIGKAVSGIGHFFGGIFSGGSSNAPKVNTPKINTGGFQDAGTIAANLKVNQTKLNLLNEKIAKGTATNADYEQANFLSNQIIGLKAQQTIYKSGGANLSAAIKGTAKAKQSEISALAKYSGGGKAIGVNNHIINGADAGTLKFLQNGDTKAEFLRATSGMSADAQAKLWGLKQKYEAAPDTSDNIVRAAASFIKGQKSADVAWQMANPLAAMTTDKNLFNRINVDKARQSQSGLVKTADFLLGKDYTKNLTHGQASARYATFFKAGTTARAAQAADQAMANNQGLDASVRAKWQKLADEEKAKVAAFDKAAEKIKTTNKLTDADTNNLKNAIIQGMTNANKASGLTQSGLTDAFSKALGGKGIAGMLATIEQDLHARL